MREYLRYVCYIRHLNTGENIELCRIRLCSCPSFSEKHTMVGKTYCIRGAMGGGGSKEAEIFFGTVYHFFFFRHPLGEIKGTYLIMTLVLINIRS